MQISTKAVVLTFFTFLTITKASNGTRHAVRDARTAALSDPIDVSQLYSKDVSEQDRISTFSTSHNTRQEDISYCGPSYGNQSCPSPQCCSSNTGRCGTDSAFCKMPNSCWPEFGQCDNDDDPLSGGYETLSAGRRRDISAIPKENVFSRCAGADMIALTYDDGPTENTRELLAVLAEYDGAKATFFISGHNNGKTPIDQDIHWRSSIHGMRVTGHQVASHTWTHQNLSAISQYERRSEMLKNEVAISNILSGVFPTYMRAPYLSCTEESGCAADIRNLGYRIIEWSVDSGDWQGLSLDAMKANIDRGFDSNINRQGMITIQHETHRESALDLTKYILEKARNANLRPVTVGECLGDKQENWYMKAIGVDTDVKETTSTATVVHGPSRSGVSAAKANIRSSTKESGAGMLRVPILQWLQ